MLFNDPKVCEKGVIVVQEWWGLNQQILAMALDISKRGNFTTIVPDLYRGEVATNNEQAGHLMASLDWPGAVQDIQGSAKYLIRNGCTKVGVIGFCMGGALSLAAASLVPQISAAAPFYGIPAAELADMSKIKIPLQCHFGDYDAHVGFSSKKDQIKLQKLLDAGGVKYEFFGYPAHHAFTNASGPNYNAEMTERAINRAVDFFVKNLA
ncbi:hypothetical protein LOTGIDRAFT_112179 [Lottia gigantea]|uniref:Dienelactone hydrolase domain-containing protein n=1 Tax=Lottia gigantea TaxID=225164 RepID=V4B2N6_LOTGI|nr:hypothetical protein LOTGIDRAFT_112179 [Lottia gigantea]ESP00717.1 hypothetical protein LOTGIDRAFT_112179 [Lottia gigantea]